METGLYSSATHHFKPMLRLYFFPLSIGVSTCHPLSGAVQFLQPTLSVNLMTLICLQCFAGDQGLNYNIK